MRKMKILGVRLLVLGLCLCLFSSGVMAEELEKNTVIQGIKCAKGNHTSFYKSEKLEFARLFQDQEVQGIKFSKGTYLIFYKSGKIRIAHLSQNQNIEGVEYKQRTGVFFDEKGKVTESY